LSDYLRGELSRVESVTLRIPTLKHKTDVPNHVGFGKLLNGDIFPQLTGSPIPEMSEDNVQQEINHRRRDKQEQPRSKAHPSKSKIKHACTNHHAWQTE